MKNMMKKNCLFLLAAFAAVILSLTACSSSDEADLTTPEQPTEPDADRGVVKTEFTISFPANAASTGNRRLSANTVQVPGEGNVVAFRGIKNIELYSFSGLPSAIGDTWTSRITLYGNGIDVSPNGYSGNTDAIAKTGALYAGSNSHLYQDVDIPIGTQSFVFFGEAATEESEDAVKVGALERTQTSVSKLSDIGYRPVSIFNGTSVGNNGQTIADYLTSIADTKTSDGKRWADSDNVGLQTLYLNFIKIHTGAWANVKAIVTAMYDNLAARDADSEETKAMKTAIRASITNNDTYGVSYTGTALSFSKVYGNYPADLKLPDGAAYVNWQDSTVSGTVKKCFVPLKDKGHTGMNIPSFSSYVHPAALYYRVLSGIKTSEAAKNAFDNDETWTAITNAFTDGEAVSSKTRSIAIVNPVQYAVGRLDVTVEAASSLQDAAGNTVAMSDGVSTNYFPITAILVGGQRPVDWKFEQVTSSSTVYTIYDPEVTASQYLKASTATAPFYTLALETKEATALAQPEAVAKIVVELRNDSPKSFVGANGEIVYPGCKFYLIGTLDPYDSSTNTKNTTGQHKAFIQDYHTVAKLKVTKLDKAYVTLPDLTVPELELGLSVDLSWKDGIEQTIIID